MRNRIASVIPVIGLTVVLGLAGCAGTTDDGTIDTDATTDVVEGTDPALGEDAEDGVWVLTELTQPLATSKYSLNAQGDIAEVTTFAVSMGSASDMTDKTTFSYDADGHISEVVSDTGGKKEQTVQVAVDVDKNGNVISEKESGENGTEHIYEYDKDSHLVRMTTKSRGLMTVSEYEDGLLVSQTSDDCSMTVSYMQSQKGAPVSANVTVTKGLASVEYEIAYELDDNGNVGKSTTKVVSLSDAAGNPLALTAAERSVTTYQYKFVKDASADAKVHTQYRLADALVADTFTY